MNYNPPHTGIKVNVGAGPSPRCAQTNCMYIKENAANVSKVSLT